MVIKSGIYKISFINTEKFYIGSAIHLFARRRNHLSDLRCQRHPNAHMQNLYNKHTESNFVFEVLERVEPYKLVEREQYYIDALKPNINILLVAHSSLGYKHSLKTLDKIKADAQRKANTIEWRDKVSVSWFAKGRVLSDLEKNALKHRMLTNNPFKGRQHTEATKKIMSEKALSRDKSVYNLTGLSLGADASKVKVKVTLGDKTYVCNSVKEASSLLGYSKLPGHIRKSIKEKNYYINKTGSTKVEYYDRRRKKEKKNG